MKTINFLLDGFGYTDLTEFNHSVFGFMLSTPVIKSTSIIAIIASAANTAFGLDWMFLVAYAVLIMFEWITGVLASRIRNEKHQSRKLGRMLLKIAVYTVPLYILNTFQAKTNFPKVFGYEVDPFIWVYWVVLMIIIWQLIVSLLENLDDLNFRWAKIALKVINKKFYQKLDIEENE